MSNSDEPFEIPSSWVWARLGEITTFGECDKASDITDTTWVLDLEDIEKDTGRIARRVTFAERRSLSDKNVFRAQDVLYGKLRPYLNKVAVADAGGVCTTEILSFRGYGRIDPQYLRNVIQSPYFLAYVNAKSYGMKMPRLGTDDGRNAWIPLAPLAEQNRIVARVEELMKLCDALEQNGRLADEQHARLTSTLFDALAASESAHALAENWQRVAEHFDLLLDRPEAIDALEQTILQLAVRGLLVPQAANDEPAVALLRRLRLRRQPSQGESATHIAPIDGPAAPYELPSTWAWTSLNELVENMGSGWSPACDEGERSDPNRWAVLRTTSVQVMEYRPREHKAIPLKLIARPDIEVRAGDILITRAGPMNRVGISCWVDQTPPRLMLSDKIIRFHPIDDEMAPAFIVLALNAGWTKDQLQGAKTGMAASQVNISQSDLRQMILPVCSKAEQRRIVARVEQLRRLCADLRQRLTQARETQSSLADALVAEFA